MTMVGELKLGQVRKNIFEAIVSLDQEEIERIRLETHAQYLI